MSPTQQLQEVLDAAHVSDFLPKLENDGWTLWSVRVDLPCLAGSASGL